MSQSDKSVSFLLEQKKRLARQLDRLANEIQEYQIDYQRFFAGDLPLPPSERSERIQRNLRSLRGSRVHGVAERFRLGSLEARFNSYSELFARRQREHERGAKAAVPPPLPDPAQGVVVGRRSKDGAVESLYQGLYLEQGNGKPQMDLERFRSYLGRQVETIREKTGCSDVLFRVAVEDGKMKLKARPLRPQSGAKTPTGGA